MLHAELSRHQVNININVCMLIFWLSLINSKINMLSHIMYNLLRAETKCGIYEHKWIKTHAKKITTNWPFRCLLRKRLIMSTLSKPALRWCSWIRIFNNSTHHLMHLQKVETTDFSKVTFNLKITYWNFQERYTTHLYNFALQTTNSQSNKAVGVMSLLNERTCTKCTLNCFGDEFHYLFECKYFKHDRHLLIKRYFYIRPNIL